MLYVCILILPLSIIAHDLHQGRWNPGFFHPQQHSAPQTLDKHQKSEFSNRRDEEIPKRKISSSNDYESESSEPEEEVLEQKPWNTPKSDYIPVESQKNVPLNSKNNFPDVSLIINQDASTNSAQTKIIEQKPNEDEIPVEINKGPSGGKNAPYVESFPKPESIEEVPIDDENYPDDIIEEETIFILPKRKHKKHRYAIISPTINNYIGRLPPSPSQLWQQPRLTQPIAAYPPQQITIFGPGAQMTPGNGVANSFYPNIGSPPSAFPDFDLGGLAGLDLLGLNNPLPTDFLNNLNPSLGTNNLVENVKVIELESSSSADNSSGTEDDEIMEMINNLSSFPNSKLSKINSTTPKIINDKDKIVPQNFPNITNNLLDQNNVSSAKSPIVSPEKRQATDGLVDFEASFDLDENQEIPQNLQKLLNMKYLLP